MTPALKLHPGLLNSSRLSSLARKDEAISISEWMILLGIGIGTAVISTVVDLHLRIPGHSILKIIFPISAGLALVPRRGAGSVMGTAALLTSFGLRLSGMGGEGLGIGALTSLTVIGPITDWSLRKAESTKSLYIGFLLSGLFSNLLAMLVRGSLKGLGFDHPGGRSFLAWFSQAIFTYTLCGIIAGAVSAFVWFSLRPHQNQSEEES